MADVERDMHDPDKNYIYGITQLEKDIVPADENDSKESLFRFSKMMAETLHLEGFVGGAYSVTPPAADASHDFYVTEGVAFLSGLLAYLGASVSWLLPPYATVPQRSLHSVVSQVGSSGVQDVAMQFVATSLVGKKLRVQRKYDSVVLVYDITSNTENFIGVSGNPSVDGVEPGCSYCVVPEDVTVDRNDLVCLNVWVGEADHREDEDLLHPVIADSEAMSRKKMRATICVLTDVDPADPISDLPVPYVDANGDSHEYHAVAAIERTAGVNTISAGDITPLATELKNLDHFLMLDSTNGPLLGPLKFMGDLTVTGNILIPTGRIQGDEITLDFGTGQLNCGALYPMAITTNIITATQARFGTVAGEIVGWGAGTVPDISAYIDISYPGDIVFAVPSGDLVNLHVAYPRLASHAANKKYVEYMTANHSHDGYLDKRSLQAMQAFLTPAQAIALAVAAYGSSTINPGEYITWVHGLGTEYVLVQARIRATVADPWEEDPSVIKYFVEDSNTVTIHNASLSPVNAERIMAVAFSVPTIKVISINEPFAIDAMGESSVTTVL